MQPSRQAEGIVRILDTTASPTSKAAQDRTTTNIETSEAHVYHTSIKMTPIWVQTDLSTHASAYTANTAGRTSDEAVTKMSSNAANFNTLSSDIEIKTEFIRRGTDNKVHDGGPPLRSSDNISSKIAETTISASEGKYICIPKHNGMVYGKFLVNLLPFDYKNRTYCCFRKSFNPWSKNKEKCI